MSADKRRAVVLGIALGIGIVSSVASVALKGNRVLQRDTPTSPNSSSEASNPIATVAYIAGSIVLPPMKAIDDALGFPLGRGHASLKHS